MKKDFILNNKLDTSSLVAALGLIEKSRYILIVTHVNPDADTIASALALSNYFLENKINHKVFNVGSDLPRNLDFINGYSKITNQLPKSYDLLISVDCGAKSRLGIDIPKNIPHINFDHHKSNDNFGTINLVDPFKSSTSEVVYDFFKFNGLYITKNSATAMYVGIYDDSLAFTVNRCDEFTYGKINYLVKCGANPSLIADLLTRRDSLAKYRILPKIFESLELHNEGKIATIYAKPEWFKQTGATLLDTEVALNMVLNISVVKIAIYFRVSNEKVRVSLRSKEKIDVSTVAAKFNGGGHLNAAGCSLECNDVFEAKEIVLKEFS
ncbi:MAG: DHH family phosphoesterase [Candidatus Marinarcus sp.]|uniref:DHH family phosphoesterase n=1 Tax=Candidatus Marinarcus sp. TaxID=3100987 RepID=UPI003AFF62BB